MLVVFAVHRVCGGGGVLAHLLAVDAQVAYRVAGIHVEKASVDSRIGAAPLCERRDFGEGAVADEGQTAM